MRVESAVVLAVATAVLSMLLAWVGRPVALGGLTVDDHLRVTSREGLPVDAAIAIGDRLEAVDGIAVSSFSELSAIISMEVRASTVRIRVAQAPRVRDFPVARGALGQVSQEIFAPGVKVVRIGDRPAPPDVDSALLERMLGEAGDEAVVVTVQRAGEKTEGSLPLVRSRPTLLSVLWALTAAIAGTTLLLTLRERALRLWRRHLAIPWLFAATLAGTSALAVAASGGAAPRLMLWAAAFGLLHRALGLSLARTASARWRGGNAPWIAGSVAVASLGLAAFTTASSLASAGGLGWLASAESAAIAICLLLVAVRGMDAIERKGRSERHDRRWAMAAVALVFDLVAVGLLLFHREATSSLLGTVMFGATAAGALADATVLAGEAGGRETLRAWLNRVQSELPPGYSVAVAAFPAKVGILVDLEPLPEAEPVWQELPPEDGSEEAEAPEPAPEPPPEPVGLDVMRELRVDRLDPATSEMLLRLREQVSFEAIFDEEEELTAGGELAAMRVIDERVPRAVPRMVVIFRDAPAPPPEGLMTALEGALPSLSSGDSYTELIMLATGHLASSIKPKAAEPEPAKQVRAAGGGRPNGESGAAMRHDRLRSDATADLERSDFWSVEERSELLAAAPGEASWLILGEPGTGKGLVARALHLASERRDAPFIELDVSTFDDATLASTLFGDAGTGRDGLLKAAHGGTVTLRSVSHLQPRLLEAILRRLERLPVRVILCEHAPWSGDHGGTVVPNAMLKFVGNRVLERSPLRARPREVERLVTRTLQQASARFARPAVRVSADGMRYLKGLPLRGNHAELEAVLLGACFAVEGSLLTVAALSRTAAVVESTPEDGAGPSSV
jgi:hypothetical protein